MTVVMNWQQPVLGVVDRKHANTHDAILHYIVIVIIYMTLHSYLYLSVLCYDVL